MKNTTCTTTQSEASTANEFDHFYIKTIDPREVNPISNYDQFESRLSEAIALSALLKELVCPSWLKKPLYKGSNEIIAPFTCNELPDEAREGLGYVAGRIESMLMECSAAIYYSGKKEVSK